MGIRFRCPNGHKLHVKDFLAGKRGICPKCGAKFQIPQESEPDLVKGSKRAEDEVADVPGPVAPASPTPTELPQIEERPSPAPADAKDAKTKSQPQPEAPVIDPDTAVARKNKRRKAKKPVDSDVQVAEPNSTASVTAEDPSPSASEVSVSPASATDPIAEAPHAVWYVRPPSGGQFGPASGDIMRSWISEGRVTIDSLVWREGWPEWKPAGDTFPGIISPTPASAPSPEIPHIVTEPANAASSMEVYRRRKSTKTTMSVVVLLILACVILFGALIYVVQFMN